MVTKRKMISVVCPCYNEADNVEELCRRVRAVMEELPYEYEHILIDNCSSDSTVDIVKKIAALDVRVKLIVNARNFGHIRSPCHGLLQASGDAAVIIASDLQDPPELIPQFIEKWEAGFKSVMAVKPESRETPLMFFLRRTYYALVDRISDTPLISNATGAGLYDKCVLDVLRSVSDPYPYFRGLICEIGYEIATVSFVQPRRLRGVTKNNFYTLYDLAMLGVTNHSKVPLRLLTMGGFFMAALSVLIAFVFFVAKLVFWDYFQLGMAPVLIGLFFFGAVQMLSVGIIGEYVGSIHTKVRNLPLVVERERVNF